MASLTDLFNPTFLMFLGILVLVVALLVVYFESKLREQNHKITSLVSVISSLAEQTTNINQAIHVLTSVNNQIGGLGNVEPIVVTHLNNLVKPNNESILINVSDDESDDGSSEESINEYEDASENESKDGSEENSIDESEGESECELDDELFYNIVEDSEEGSNIVSDSHLNESICENYQNFEKDTIIFMEKYPTINDNTHENTLNNLDESDNNIKVLKIDISNLEELHKNELVHNFETLQENSNVEEDNNVINVENCEDVEELLEDVNESSVFNNLKTININLDDSKNESVDYKKMSLNKLREIVTKKGLVADSSKFKKNELLKLLDSE